jgi:uncharacterized protein (TIGR03435 family)
MLYRMLLLSALSLPAPPLAFDVASVKLHPIPEGYLRRAWSARIECPPWHCGIAGMRFTEDVASLADLIMDAYAVRRFQIAGLPSWGDSGRDVYDIAATAPGDQPPTLGQARRMLQTLLSERFQLKIHHETRDLPAYALTIAKSGSKLKPCEADADPRKSFRDHWDQIPELLGAFTDRPVFDKTGYEGYYCTADDEAPVRALDMPGLMVGRGGRPPDSEFSANIFTEVERKWGMKLEPQRGPVDVIVIDHVSRPSAN